jgi:hypothetical protein
MEAYMARVGIAVGVIGSTTRAALLVALGALTLGAVVATRQALAQEPVQAQDSDEVTLLSADALAELVGPIALYPDDLVGVVLPASTYPLQVVQAARFLDERAKNANLEPSEDWDDSVVALLNYPEVVKLLNDDLDWTWRLGDAVINQRADVLEAIQGFRDRAYAAGNLRTDNRQVVENDDAGAITIKPADPEVIYVPYYEPERVVVYQRAPVYYYYPVAYPVYYYPYPSGYSFHSGFFWGVTSVFSIGWHTHHLYLHDHHYWGHPYYGRTYYDPFYYRRAVNVSVSRGGYVWEPHYRHGAQPFTRSDGRRFVGTREGRGASMPGSYRSGAVSRSAGQQPRDPSAAPTRNRATPGTGPRTEGNGGTYRGGASGTARTAPQPGATTRGQQRFGRVESGSQSDGQANQPARSRETGQPREQSRAAPPASATPRAREAAPPASAPANRAPGQYRSGGTLQRYTPGVQQGNSQSRSGGGASQRYTPAPTPQARSGGASQRSTLVVPTPQARAGGAAPRYAAPAQRQESAPAARATPPPAASQPRTFSRSTGGGVSGGSGSGAYRGESAAAPRPQSAAPQRAESAAPPRAERADPGPSSRGESRAAPSYRGGGNSRGNGGRHER